MGIGGALWENLPYDRDGRPLATHLKTYVTPRASDLPSWESARQVTPSPYTTLGTKGAGETGVGGALSSITNAVNDALVPEGIRLHALPFSPMRVLAALAGEEPR